MKKKLHTRLQQQQAAEPGSLNRCEIKVEEVYRQYSASVFVFIQRHLYVTHDYQDAKYLTTETFFALHEALEERRFVNTSIKAWLFAVARNLVINHVRKKENQPKVPLENLDLSEHPISEMPDFLSAEEMRSQINGVIISMKDKRDIAFLRLYWDNDGKPTTEQIKIFMEEWDINRKNTFDQIGVRANDKLIEKLPWLGPLLTGRRRKSIISPDSKKHGKNEKR